MNTLTRALAKVCQTRILDEKWLVAPSLRVGHQWLEAVVRAGQPTANVRVSTLKSFALELAGMAMAERGVQLVSAEGGALLVDSILTRTTNGDGGYLSSLQPSPGLSQMVITTINAIRLAGMNIEDLRPDAFEVVAKAEDMARLIQRYLEQLDALKLVDYATVLAIARHRLQDDPAALADDVLILVPEDAECTAMERDLLEAIPKQKLHLLPVDQPLTPVDALSTVVPDAVLLQWLPSPTAAPSPSGDGSAEVFRAIGEINEVREVFRRCLAMGQPLDEVEVLHTDTEAYVPLFYELAWRLQSEKDTNAEDLPITFAEGIPVRYSRPGRALRAWLAWVAEGYPQADLVRMIQDGLLSISGHDPKQYSFSSLAVILRSVSIGLGRDRYLPKLAEQIAGCEQRLVEALAVVDEDGEVHADAQVAMKRRLEGLKVLDGLIRRLLAITPQPKADPADILEAASQLLKQLTRTVNEFDNYALLALAEEIDEMRGWLKQASLAVSHDFWDWLATLADRVRVGGSGPRPGRLHVAHALTGGHSGRAVTFVVGLDDARFPGAGLQDPLLLDHERHALSSRMPTAAGQVRDKLQQFARLLARLRGRVVLSYCCHDLADDREMFPSPVLLAAYRILSGKRDGDQADLLQWLPPPASFAPHSPERCFDEAEWWLWRLCGPEPVADVSGLVAKHFPHLGRGQRAASQRRTEEFSVFDGMVPEAGAAHDPTQSDGPVLSASSLEILGRCPFAYFLHYLLRIEPPDELAVDRARWLDPLAFGSLLHEVFRQFLADLCHKNLLPMVARDEPSLMTILDRQIAAYRDLYPPPNESVYRTQCRQLREAARVFLTREEDFCKHSRPEYLEVSLGMAAEGEATPLDDPEPILVPLPSGRAIRARGRIDRIDRIGEESRQEFAVWDYKTGRIHKKYRDADPFAKGRLVQHALYLSMVESALRRNLHCKAVVRQSGYYFPTGRGQGERVGRSREDLIRGGQVIQNLCEIVAGGAFLATNQSEDCGCCVYQLVCQDVASTTDASQRKLANGGNPSLKPMRELRDNG
jgi:ATP-dependent helicase/nuclease subunit B